MRHLLLVYVGIVCMHANPTRYRSFSSLSQSFDTSKLFENVTDDLLYCRLSKRIGLHVSLELRHMSVAREHLSITRATAGWSLQTEWAGVNPYCCA
jgi:hypothetical protein